MELEKQVTSLELSKRLKELGVEQESLFCWEKIDWEGKNAILKYRREVSAHNGWIISAFTVAELGEMLPDGVASGKHENKAAHKYGKYHCKWFTKKMIYNQRADTEADARAKMLIYIK